MRPAPPRVVVSRLVRASRERAFRAWTDPAAISRWFHPVGFTTPSAEADVRVGGGYRVAMRPPEGATVFAFGTYLEIDEPRRLVFTWRWEGTDHDDIGESVVTVEFRERDGGTEILLQHEKIAAEPMRHRHEEGWRSCLESLAGWLEG